MTPTLSHAGQPLSLRPTPASVRTRVPAPGRARVQAHGRLQVLAHRLLRLAGMLALLLATAAMAEEGPRLITAPTKRLDVESLQRGARNFVNYCLNCHSAQYMRYNRLMDLGLSEDQVKDNLMLATDRIGDPMTTGLSKADGKSWFGTAPPDLSVEARIRGKDWLYSYLLAFYRDDRTVTGWNNLVFPNVAMPHVLWNLSGTQRLVENEFDDREKADSMVIAAKGLAEVERTVKGKYVVKTLALDAPGSLTPVEYQVFVADLVNYLDYMAEPAKARRINVGIIVLIGLGVLFALVYALKRDYWSDIH